MLVLVAVHVQCERRVVVRVLSNWLWNPWTSLKAVFRHETLETEKLHEMLQDVRFQHLQGAIDVLVLMYMAWMVGWPLMIANFSDHEIQGIGGLSVTIMHLLVYAILLLIKFGPESFAHAAK